jgi:hypothetical protein
MKRYYTVDRANGLSEGLCVNLVKYTDVDPCALQVHFDALFPKGVTAHGEQYFVQPTAALKIDGLIELVFEYVRRSHFSRCPSRAQSFFAWGTMEDAIIFMNITGYPQASIWEVEAEEAFKCDMNWLKAADSVLVMSYRAHQYWQGSSSDQPFWEFLLKPPVRILQKLDGV